jgi:hypothetical protein
MSSRRVSAAVAAGLLGAAAFAAPAVAEPPRGGPFQHTHHVHTGDGGCVDIDSVMFNPDHRGLHQGSNASGLDRGPWHGTCAGEVFPGGPPLPPFVPHH